MDTSRPPGEPRPLSSASRAATAAGSGSILARLRLRAAQLPLPALPDGQIEVLESWLASLPLPTEEAPREPLSALGLSITGELNRITWFAAGDPATMIPPMAEFLEGIGAGEEEMDRLGAAGAAIEPAFLGSFLESRADGMNAGWFIPGRGDFRPAMGQVDYPPHRDALLRWAADYPTTEVLSVGRAMGVGEPFTRLTVSLPQATLGDLSDALPAAGELFDALGAPLPPDEALAELQAQPPSALGAAFWLSRDGLFKAALVGWQPTLSLIIALAQTAGVQESLDPLAMLQGWLDVDDASAVELQMRADGYGIELLYELL